MISYTGEVKKKILIADDSEFNCDLLSEILGDKYDYIYAEDGQAAISLLSDNIDVDILLLDMNMPHLSGMNVLKVMRDKNWLDEIPVVVISAESDINYIQNAYYLGAVDYILRPFNAFQVCHRVETTLGMYAQRKLLAQTIETQVYHQEKINNTLINIFSRIVEMRNFESGSHTVNVQTTTKLLLKHLVQITDKYSLSDNEISMISSVSALHDIGKIMIPDNILNKPGKLTPEEWEIMKTHTTNGNDFLNSIPIDQNDRFVCLAHEICRHHHERYDGKGYPDGLVGDNIPISAQAVSIADAYDALPSDRCYKKAFSHETAVSMICNGECGAFNPLLVQCFKEISDQLIINKQLNNQNSVGVTEIRDEDGISETLTLRTSRQADQLNSERIKKEFFAERCNGLQFEYDAILKKVLYIKYFDGDGKAVQLESSITHLLSEADLEKLKALLSRATPQAPNAEMTVKLPITGYKKWHKMRIRTIWSPESAFYVGLVGYCCDVEEKILSKYADIFIGGKAVTAESYSAICGIFDIVYLVDPKTCSVLTVDENGVLRETEQKCYEMWNRNEHCNRCTSKKAMKCDRWVTKAETKDGFIYSILSRSCKYGDRDCILEIAFCIDDSFNKKHSKMGYYLDNHALENLYLDPLTKTFSRNYMENFLSYLENSSAIAIADIDSFKKVNDTYGHLVGDTVLRHVAKVIKSCVDTDCTIIRYGGDEFLFAFDNISEEEFFGKLSEIKQAVKCSVIEEHPQIRPAISIGGVYAAELSFEKAVDLADKAMYKDKFKNKN